MKSNSNALCIFCISICKTFWKPLVPCPRLTIFVTKLIYIQRKIVLTRWKVMTDKKKVIDDLIRSLSRYCCKGCLTCRSILTAGCKKSPIKCSEHTRSSERHHRQRKKRSCISARLGMMLMTESYFRQMVHFLCELTRRTIDQQRVMGKYLMALHHHHHHYHHYHYDHPLLIMIIIVHVNLICLQRHRVQHYQYLESKGTLST